MARILLLSATPAEDEIAEHRRPLEFFRESAAADRFGAYSLTDNPETADAIIFVENYGAGWHFERVRAHPFVKRHREKCFIFCANPFVIPFLPGVYTSIGRRWTSARVVSGFYPAQPANEFAIYTPPTDALPYLFSFMGSIKTAPVRQALAEVKHPRAFFRNTESDFQRVLNRKMPAAERDDYYRRYAELIAASKFVLCPRGLSVSSIRLFETIAMGRVPVIISDDWVPPPGPAWERFSMRVAERDVAQIPRLLEEREGEAVAMGKLAHAQWREWFAPDVAFHRVAEWCLALKVRRRVPEAVARWPVYLQYLRPFHFRRAVGTNLRRIGSAVGLNLPAPAERSVTVRF